MNLLFCHDHFFKIYNDNYYSQGKLDYSKFEFYLQYFDNINVIGRGNNVTELSPSLFKSNGPNVDVFTLPNLSSIKGMIQRRHAEDIIDNLVKKSDAVIVRLPSEIGLLAQKVAIKNNKPVLVEVVANAKDCLWFSNSLIKKMYSFILERRVRKSCANASDVIYVTKEYLQTKYPTDNNSYWASDVIIDSISFPKKWNIKRKYTIGMIGNPDLKIKGAKVLYNAVSILRNKGIDIEVKILGGSGQVIEKSLPEGVGEWFIFDGVLAKRQDVADWLSDLDIYVQPSFTEGMPRSLLEAMACGLPCIASNVGGMPELISNEYLFSPGDDTSLASLIENLIKEESSYNRQSKMCVEVVEEFTQDILREKRNACFKNFIGRINS